MAQYIASSSDIVIIGGGFSGLATAAILASEGYRVTLLEKNADFGGRARVYRDSGFSFDMGPSWYLMPEVFEQFFALFGKKPSDYYDLVRLDPRYELFFPDGERVTITDDLTATTRWFESVEPGAGEKLKKFLLHMEGIYTDATTRLMHTDIRDPQLVFGEKNRQALLSITTKLAFWDSWSNEVKRYFQHEKLLQALGFPAVFLGGSPYSTPALYSILTFADYGKGVWYPRGGMQMVVAALVELATEYGVTLRQNACVTAIEVEDGVVSGVVLGKERIATTTVIGATDIPHVELTLLPEKYRAPEIRWSRKKLGISALLLYLGLDTRLTNIQHHSIFFAKDWEKNFREILDEHVFPDDPSLYVSARSVTDGTIVPQGNEELFVLVPLGAGTTSTKEELQKYSHRIIKLLEKKYDQDIESHIVVKKIFGPDDFATEYHAYAGTALGLAHTLDQSLWFRPYNRSSLVRGLYYTGQYTNPGVGVPMALISAQQTAALITSVDQSNQSIFKRGSVTYSTASIFFPKKVRQEVATLYAYVRTIDDLVDSLTPDRDTFEEYWQQTQHAWAGKRVESRVVTQFVRLAKRYDFAWEWIVSFWDAMRADFTKKTYTSQELDTYMYGSAEVIGLMMARILGLPKSAEKSAAMQGKAMQYANFIRDVAEDRDLGRNYLGFSEKEATDPVAWAQFVRRAVSRYQQYQETAAKGYAAIPYRYRIPIQTAADMYSWTADALSKDPSIVWRKKLKPRPIRVILQALFNLWRAR